MISLVVTADTKNYNPAERDQAFAHLMTQFKQPYEIVYVANSDYGYLDELREIAATHPHRKLVVTAASTNINTQIYTALDQTQNGDCLLITMDTNIDLIKKMLIKHFDGADLVFVKQQENWFKSMFIGLGHATYQMGLKLLGRGRDMCCDARVILLNNRSVNTIILNPVLSKALRLVNPDPERNVRVLTEPKIYDNPTTEQKVSNNSFLALGVVSLFYIIALLVMAIIFPIFNSGVYTIWILIALVVWIILGIVGSVVVAKFIYNNRLGFPVAINLANEPVINIEEIISNDIVEEPETETEIEPETTEDTPILNDEESAKVEDIQNEIDELKEMEATNIKKSKKGSKSKSKTADAAIKAEEILETEAPIEQENTAQNQDLNKNGQDTEAQKAVTENFENNSEVAEPQKEVATTPKAKNTTKKAAPKKTTTAKSVKSGAKKPQISKIKSTRGAKTKK